MSHQHLHICHRFRNSSSNKSQLHTVQNRQKSEMRIAISLNNGWVVERFLSQKDLSVSNHRSLSQRPLKTTSRNDLSQNYLSRRPLPTTSLTCAPISPQILFEQNTLLIQSASSWQSLPNCPRNEQVSVTALQTNSMVVSHTVSLLPKQIAPSPPQVNELMLQ